MLEGKECFVAQSCPTLCSLVECSLLGSSVRGIFQAALLEWVVISCSRKERRWMLKGVFKENSKDLE